MSEPVVRRIGLRPARSPAPSTCARSGGLDEAEQAARTALAEHPRTRALLRALSVVLLGARGDRHEEGLAAADAAVGAGPGRASTRTGCAPCTCR